MSENFLIRSFWFCFSYNCTYPQISTLPLMCHKQVRAEQWSKLFVSQLYTQLYTSQPAAEIDCFAMYVCCRSLYQNDQGDQQQYHLTPSGLVTIHLILKNLAQALDRIWQGKAKITFPCIFQWKYYLQYSGQILFLNRGAREFSSRVTGIEDRILQLIKHILFRCAQKNQCIVLEYFVVDKIVFTKQTVRLNNWIHYSIGSMKGFPFLCGQVFLDK